MEGGGTPYSSSMAPSGSYILIVVSQPVTEEHKQVILDRLDKGLLSWDVDSTGCDLSGLETVCADITAKHLSDTDVLIQHSTESLGVEVLVSPTVSTLKQCVKNLFSTATGHKHLIHAGYAFAGSGSWVLQDGTFSLRDLLDILKTSSKSCHVHCAELGPWATAGVLPGHVRLNPGPSAAGRVPGAEHLRGCLERVLSPQALEEMMEASALVGNIRFNRPTLYVFPAGQGDCALFGVNGFNMLVDGGFNRKPCAWEFVRHLDRLDAVLVTRLCENNVCGVATLVKRKALNNTYPQIGYVFCNMAEDGASPKAEMVKYEDDLAVSVVGEGHTFTNTLNELKLKPQNCWRDASVDPFVLYHKVGHGTLEMHVLSPPKDSKEMKEFLSEWSSYKETFSNAKSGLKSKNLESCIPLSHATSICAVLVWRPADPKDTITRILFPGSAPQSKIFESLEKLKALDVLKQPVVTKASLSVVTKSVAKSAVGGRASVPSRKSTASPALSVSSAASRNGDVTKKDVVTKKVVKEVVKKDNKDVVKKEVVKKEVAKKEVAAVKKTESVIKKDPAPKKEVAKDPKKEVKKVVKKEIKEVKSSVEKKATPKKVETASPASKTIGEVKKAATTTVRKSTTPLKKDVSKPAAPKPSEAKKPTPSKVSEPKTAKEVSNKKAAEAKSVPKTKPKTPTSKTSPPKAKTPASPASKGPSSMTKALAASSIVASAVAVTAAAFDLNEKKEEIAAEIAAEQVAEKEPEVVAEEQPVEEKPIEKAEEINETNIMPPEAPSPTPSESVSLTPSDTLSSAPLETVSPTPPLGNEPVSMEEKEVNEIKEIDQDLETIEGEEEVLEGAEAPQEEPEAEENDIEMELARRQKNDDMMSMSFVGMQDEEEPVEEEVCKVEAAPEQFASAVREEEKIDEDKEIDSAEKIELQDEIESEKAVVESDQKEFDNDDEGVENDEKDIDDQLAHMSMEGSFCAGRPYDQDILAQVEEIRGQHQEEEEEVPEKIDLATEKETNKEFCEDEEVQQSNRMHESLIAQNGDAGFGEEEDDDDYENKEVLDVEEKIQPSHVSSTMAAPSGHFDDNQFSAQREDDFEEQEKEVEEEKEVVEREDEFSGERFENNKYMAEYDNRYQDILADSEMQETSVDEPEEVVRKESTVSITLEDFDDDRRKSCTESEDDVDIRHYMAEDAGGNLGVQRDSDDEDVVKSPTPHAVVDFEDVAAEKRDGEDDVAEKQDVDDEKDRDSAEDGEMIRHPTPPGMKYSEEEMRDPIGPHFITTPGLTQQVSGLTEEPLYEENEDAGSERSISPVVVEQPVFGNTVQADFPELVTVSGGTTPSEPQSPGGRFGTDPAAVMDALSEHDCSESSAHSPLVHEEASAFEMPEGKLKEEDFEEKGSSGVHEASGMIESETAGMEEVESEIIQKEVAESYESEMVQEDESHEPHVVQNEKSYESPVAQKDESYEPQAIQKEESYESSAIQRDDYDGSVEYSTLHKDDYAGSFEPSTIQKDDYDESFEPSTIHKDNYDESFEPSAIHKDDYAGSLESSTIHKDDYAGSFEPSTIHEDDYAGSYESSAVPQVGEVSAQSPVTQIVTEAVIEKQSEPHSADNDSEDESCSQNDQSETRSEKSDIHKDDKSDNQHDGKSDAMDDDQLERRSDIDDKSDSHYDDRQDDYDSKGADNYDMQDGTRSHGLNQEQYGTEPEMHYETKQESNVPQDILQDPIGSVDSFDRQSLTEESSFNIQQGEEFDTNSASVSEISQIKTEAYEQHFEGMEKYNVDDKSDYTESNLPGGHEDSSKLLNSAVPDDIHLPAGLNDKENLYDNYGISQNDGASDQLDSSPSHQFPLNSASKIDDIHLEQFENTGDVLSCQTSDPLPKYEREHGAEDEEVRRMEQQGQSDVTNKFDEYNNFRSEMLQNNSDQQSYNLSHSADHSDDFAPQNVEGFSNFENKSLTEMTEAHQHETLSKFEENVHTSNAAYSDSSLTSNVVSHEGEMEDPNFNYSTHDLMQSHSEVPRDFDQSEKDDAYLQHTLEESKIGSEQSTHHGDAPSSEAYSHEYGTDDPLRNGEVAGTEPFGLTNGKESWSHNSETTPAVAEGYTAAETSYIINSRFHSDSPEDNVMRSDSSPDVPPYPLDPSGQIADLKHFESSAPVDYSNINDALPPSPVKAVNANYPASSSEDEEDEDSSSIPGTVSPYAYTNKAYAKEEEDIDGNHIYKEKTILDNTEQQGFQDSTAYTQQQGFQDGGYTQGFHDTKYTQQAFHQEPTGQSNYDFRLEEWDKPLGLPTPPETGTKTAKKTGAIKTATNGKAAPVSKLSASPLKKPKTSKEPSSSPVYLDLAYVPHHGDPQYCDVEFFKKIRARYYVFSGISPSKEVLNALLEAKKSWKEELEVTIIPTYETDTLGYWMAQNQEDLAEYSIEVAPSASRCTVNLQDHQTSCAAYRLEF